ncbi:DsbA family protein [Candidatus Dojkabacteria bacterium]|jgi:protein-disulfide isomerase|nr:DsbA family protein [Candidatus Dojkabacteria bacterium]
MKNTVKETKTENMVINLESLLIPISVLIGALMISLSIIFTFRNANITSNVKGTSDTTNTDTTNTDTNTNDGTIETVSRENSPYLGDLKTAKIAIIEFSDFECPYCKRHFTQVYPDLLKNYVDTGKAIYVFRNLPLSFHEPIATNDAMAALCVYDQGGNEAYFKMHEAIFGATNSNASNITVKILKGLVGKINGINLSKYNTCVTDKKFADQIKKDAADAAAVGISGTPGFIIGKLEADGKTVKNGTFLAGAYPIESFKTIIDELLK